MNENDPTDALHGATHIIADDLAQEIATHRLEGGEAVGDLQSASSPELLSPVKPNWNWWYCLRFGSVSGRYEGPMTSPKAGAYELELRVDIDPRGVNSPVMDRVSGDIYRVYSFNLWGHIIRWRVYERSWIVNSPSITWARCSVGITGLVTFWKGLQPATKLAITIPWGTFKAAGPASVSFYSGATVSQYTCKRRSSNFRDVTLEVDVTESVDAGTILPTYNTHAHNDRPSGIQQRDLDIVTCYAEAGIGLTLNFPSTVIDDSDAGFDTWSPGELHDAMEGAFSQFPGGWPKWHLWGLMCGSYQSSSTAGIMFDAASGYGGAGEAPERQGFAVFREHSWFDDLPSGSPSDQTEAAALRQLLYTWVHEAGHAFNYVHSWNKNRPDALSWMNYPQYVVDFWGNFEFRFDDEELIHIRHGDRDAVIMGGDAWATGLHFDGAAHAGTAEGTPPLELLVRSKGYFDFMEPVSVELRLRNLMPDLEVPIDTRLEPRWGTVTVYIMKPDGSIEEFQPVFCEIGEPEMVTLQPYGSTAGLDRHSHEVPITFGRTGHIFSVPGEYRVRAIYTMNGLGMIPSPVHTLRVGLPQSRQEDRLAQDFFSFDAGLCLVLDGSRSGHLTSGREALETVAEQCAKTMAGAKTAVALAKGLERPFFTVDYPDGKLRKVADADIEDALKLTEGALEVVRDEPKLNIDYHMLVRQRAGLLVAAGKTAEAKDEVQKMRGDLGNRGVNEPVLAAIDDYAKSLG